MQVNNSLRSEEFILESYHYLNYTYTTDRIYISKLRGANIKCPIEIDRWSGTPRQFRIGYLSRSGIGEEFHYLFTCKFHEIENLRAQIYTLILWKQPRAREYKLKGLLSICNVQLHRDVSIFLKKIVKS